MGGNGNGEQRKSIWIGLRLYSEAEDYTVAGVEVQDEFLEGHPCENLYEEIYERKKRICDKLGVEEDKDLEFLINLMDDITKNVSMKMYEYGVLIGADEF